MKPDSLETLVEIRDGLALLHDRRVGAEHRKNAPLSPFELGWLRDVCRRLGELLVDDAPTPGESEKGKGGE